MNLTKLKQQKTSGIFWNVPPLWKVELYIKISSFAIKLLSCPPLILVSHKHYWMYLAPVACKSCAFFKWYSCFSKVRKETLHLVKNLCACCRGYTGYDFAFFFLIKSIWFCLFFLIKSISLWGKETT